MNNFFRRCRIWRNAFCGKVWGKGLIGDGEVFPEHEGEGFLEERDEGEVCRGGLIL
jgi:hypothetical protein